MEWRLDKITTGNRATALETNEGEAFRRFLQLLYARYVCFRVFLECAAAMNGGITEHHKGRWLLIQVAPVTLLAKFAKPNIFLAFTRLAGGAPSEYLEEAIVTESLIIERLLPERSTLFCVLDEAQALTKNLDYFRSMTDPAQGRPILDLIVRNWRRILPNLIVSGDGISIREVETLLGARVAKQCSYPVTVTEIGGFDDEDGRRAYLERYLPPGFLDTSEGKEIASRVGYWLRGRFVFNALSDKRLLIKSIDIVLLQLISHSLSGPASSPPIKY